MIKLTLLFDKLKPKFQNVENNNKHLTDLIYRVKQNVNKDYSEVQQRFVEFYNTHNQIFVLKNRCAGFSYIMDEIAIAENYDNKKVLYIKIGDYDVRKKYKNIDFVTGYSVNETNFRGKRYDIIIIDEAAWTKGIYLLYKEILLRFTNAKIVICTTPCKTENYHGIKKLFQDAELHGNLFHFIKLKSVNAIKNLYNIHSNVEEFISEVFGIFPDVDE